MELVKSVKSVYSNTNINLQHNINILQNTISNHANLIQQLRTNLNYLIDEINELNDKLTPDFINKLEQIGTELDIDKGIEDALLDTYDNTNDKLVYKIAFNLIKAAISNSNIKQYKINQIINTNTSIISKIAEHSNYLNSVLLINIVPENYVIDARSFPLIQDLKRFEVINQAYNGSPTDFVNVLFNIDQNTNLIPKIDIINTNYVRLRGFRFIIDDEPGLLDLNNINQLFLKTLFKIDFSTIEFEKCMFMGKNENNDYLLSIAKFSNIIFNNCIFTNANKMIICKDLYYSNNSVNVINNNPVINNINNLILRS